MDDGILVFLGITLFWMLNVCCRRFIWRIMHVIFRAQFAFQLSQRNSVKTWFRENCRERERERRLSAFSTIFQQSYNKLLQFNVQMRKCVRHLNDTWLRNECKTENDNENGNDVHVSFLYPLRALKWHGKRWLSSNYGMKWENESEMIAPNWLKRSISLGKFNTVDIHTHLQEHMSTMNDWHNKINSGKRSFIIKKPTSKFHICFVTNTNALTFLSNFSFIFAIEWIFFWSVNSSMCVDVCSWFDNLLFFSHPASHLKIHFENWI